MAITIGTIQTAISAVVASVLTNAVVYDGSPNIPPPALPAVSSDWRGSTNNPPIEGAHYLKVAGKMVKKGIYRRHTFMTFVLMSATGQKPYEDAAQRDAAQAILDAIDADATLQGTTGVDQCSLCEVTTILPYTTVFSDTNYSGVEITFSVLEL